MAAITPELVKQAEVLALQAGKLKEQIVDRINEIIITCFKVFDVEYYTWYFYGAGEGDVGDLWSHIDEDQVHFIVELSRNQSNGREMIFITKDGVEWSLVDSFPTRWLYDDNFKDEMLKGKAEFEKRELERKAKKKELTDAKKAEDQKLIEEAKKKLSAKELAALRRSL